MASNHTPEPWVPWDETAFLAGKSQEHTSTHESAQEDSYEPTYTVPESDYLRAVACVNACAGINPDAIQDLLKALGDALSFVEMHTGRGTSRGFTADVLDGNGEPVAERIAHNARDALFKAEEDAS